MTVTELHPESLLDKERCGELDSADRERLEAHLAACATCRLERELQRDFRLELSKEGLTAEIAGLVEDVARAGVRPPAPSAAAPARRGSIVLLAAAAVLTLVAGAFASTDVGRRALAPLFEGRSAQTSVDQAPATSVRPPSRPSLAAAPTPPIAPPAPEPSPASAPEPPATEPPSEFAARPVVAADGAAALFDEATQARRKGDVPRMLASQNDLLARYPQSREALVSHMMVGRMLLDQGDAVRALSELDAYLRAGSGELREDALAERATALERLGRDAEARRAWLTLLEQYPNAAYASRARARIAASSGD